MNMFHAVTTRAIAKWTRHEVACTPETILPILEEAYQSCVFGNDYPPFVLLGTAFRQTLTARLLHAERLSDYGVLREPCLADYKGLDSWMAQIFMWDRESYDRPILFVGATVKLVDAV